MKLNNMLLKSGTNCTKEELSHFLSLLNQDETFLSNNPSLRAGFKQILEEKTEPYLTRGQVSKLLQISLPTLHDYTKRGFLTSYRIGFKVRYKSSEIDTALREVNFSLTKKGENHGS